MEFPITENLMSSFVEPFYNKNIKKYIKGKKTRIYLPNDCSDQMAELVFEYVKKKHKNFEVSDLKKFKKKNDKSGTIHTVYKFDIKY